MIDTTVHTYTQKRDAQALDRIRRGVAVCACGAEYRPGLDGRIEHQMKHGHRPNPPREDGAR